jgi:hypothetical protein
MPNDDALGDLDTEKHSDKHEDVYGGDDLSRSRSLSDEHESGKPCALESQTPGSRLQLVEKIIKGAEKKGGGFGFHRVHDDEDTMARMCILGELVRTAQVEMETAIIRAQEFSELYEKAAGRLQVRRDKAAGVALLRTSAGVPGSERCFDAEIERV